MFLNSSPEVSPTELRANANLNHHRKARALMGADDGSPASQGRQPAAREPAARGMVDSNIAPWDVEPGPKSSSQPYIGSFYHDDSDQFNQSSPSFRPSTGLTGGTDSPDNSCDADVRRPSVISATSVSSLNSKADISGGSKNARSRKNVLGEDLGDPKTPPESISSSSQPMLSSQVYSQGTSMPKGDAKTRLRNDSIYASDGDRPNTPLPSSAVTPWMYQKFDVSPRLWLYWFSASPQFMWAYLVLYRPSGKVWTNAE